VFKNLTGGIRKDLLLVLGEGDIGGGRGIVADRGCAQLFQQRSDAAKVCLGWREGGMAQDEPP
jgi:hypothetical protein